MNKHEVTVAIAQKTGLTKKDSKTLLEALIRSVEQALVEGESVRITDFGVFEVKERKARQGRNPRYPDKVLDIPPYKAPVFRAGRSLKEKVKKT